MKDLVNIKTSNWFKQKLGSAAAIFLFLFSASGFAQTSEIEWEHSFGGTDDDICYNMQQTIDSGYMINGLTWSSDGDVSDILYPRQALLIKYDKDGNLQWEKTFGGSLTDHSFMTDQTFDGGYIMAMESQSDDGDVPVNYGQQDFVCFKLDQGGNIVWTKVFGGTLHDHPTCIRQTHDGGYILGAASRSNDGDLSGHHGSTDYFDVWLLRMDSSGNIMWSRSLGGSYTDFTRDIEELPDGNFLLVGESYSDDGDISGHHGSTSSGDMMVMKVDAEGNFLWEKSYGGSQEEVAHHLALTPDGGCIIVGSTNSIDGDVTEIHGGYDIWVLKLDEAGNLQWQKTYGGSLGDYSTFISLAKDGNYLIAGESGSTDGDVSGNKGDNDFWLAKIDPSGTILWSTNLGGSAQDAGKSVTQISDDEYVVAGTFNSNDDDSPDHHGSISHSDSWIARVKEDVTSVVPDQGVSSAPLDLNIFPNPANEFADVSFFNSGSDQPTVSLMTIDGREVFLNNESGLKQGRQKIRINTSELLPGIYFLRMELNHQSFFSQLTIAR